MKNQGYAVVLRRKYLLNLVLQLHFCLEEKFGMNNFLVR